MQSRRKPHCGRPISCEPLPADGRSAPCSNVPHPDKAVTIQAPILHDFERVLRNFQVSISTFQSALESWEETSDLPLMFLKHSKMGVDGLTVEAVMYVMMHQN